MCGIPGGGGKRASQPAQAAAAASLPACPGAGGSSQPACPDQVAPSSPRTGQTKRRKMKMKRNEVTSIGRGDEDE